jgi:ABC-type uncharacterized transport system involved in gliding motility auxiliary subunit
MLEDYLQGGGRALFLLAAQRGPELAPVLANYGIQMGNDIVVDQVLRLFQGPALGVEPMAQSYGRHPITEGFSQRTIFPFTRSVDAIGDKKPGVEVTSIVKTSPRRWIARGRSRSASPPRSAPRRATRTCNRAWWCSAAPSSSTTSFSTTCTTAT